MPSLFAILTIIFVIAKLAGVITWPWLYVFMPTIVSTALMLLFLGVVALIAVVSALVLDRS